MTIMEIRDEREERARYAAYVDGVRIGFASSILVRETVLLPHVEVDPDRRDLGIGSMLVRRAMDDALAEGYSAIALCPFVRRWVDLHPDYLDVARRPKPGELGAVNSLVEADRTMRLLHHEESKILAVAPELEPELEPEAP